jgi:hypothetical protein
MSPVGLRRVILAPVMEDMLQVSVTVPSLSTGSGLAVKDRICGAADVDLGRGRGVGFGVLLGHGLGSSVEVGVLVAYGVQVGVARGVLVAYGVHVGVALGAVRVADIAVISIVAVSVSGAWAGISM